MGRRSNYCRGLRQRATFDCRRVLFQKLQRTLQRIFSFSRHFFPSQPKFWTKKVGGWINKLRPPIFFGSNPTIFGRSLQLLWKLPIWNPTFFWKNPPQLPTSQVQQLRLRLFSASKSSASGAGAAAPAPALPAVLEDWCRDWRPGGSTKNGAGGWELIYWIEDPGFFGQVFFWWTIGWTIGVEIFGHRKMGDHQEPRAQELQRLFKVSKWGLKVFGIPQNPMVYPLLIKCGQWTSPIHGGL